MQYLVIPFVGSINNKKGTSNDVSEQLQELINKFASQGWNYIRLESVVTFVRPNNGCFGIGGTPGYNTTRQMLVFSK